METHNVTTIAVQEHPGSPTWLKSLCGNPHPEDIEFYYKTLCGFKDAVVTVTTELVPADFTESLLALGDAEPTEFPSFPLGVFQHHVILFGFNEVGLDVFGFLIGKDLRTV